MNATLFSSLLEPFPSLPLTTPLNLPPVIALAQELYPNATFGPFLDNTTLGNATPPRSLTKPSKYAAWEVILIATITAITAIVTVLGNILVLTSFVVERALRQPSNYFIASLAVTDLLIGLFSMPAYSTYLLLERWPMPNILCDLWLSLDYTVCLVSQYNVLLITIDRFCSVKIPAKYRNWRAKRKVQIMIIATWIIPSGIFFTIHLGWDTFMGRRGMADGGCDAQYIKSNPTFNVVLIFSYFWSTMVVLLGLYAGIYQTAFTLQRKSQQKHQKMQQMVKLSTTTTGNKVVETTKQSLAVHVKPAILNDVSVVFNSTTVTQGKTVDTSVEATTPQKPNDTSGSSDQEDRSSSPTFPSDAEQNENGVLVPKDPDAAAASHKKPPPKGGTTARPHHHVFKDLKQRVAQRQQRPRGKTEMIVPKIPAPPKQAHTRQPPPQQRHSAEPERKPALIDLTPEVDQRLLASSPMSRSCSAVDERPARDTLTIPSLSQPAINTSTLQAILLAKELNDEIRLLFAQRAADSRGPSASIAVLSTAEEPEGFAEPVWVPRVPFPVRFDELPSVLLQPFTGRTPLNNTNDWRYIDQESLKSPNSSMEGTHTSTPTNRSSINSPLVTRESTPPRQTTPRSSFKSPLATPSPIPCVTIIEPVPAIPVNSNGGVLKLARPAPRVSVRPEISDIGEESTRYDSDQRSMNQSDQALTGGPNHIGALDVRNNSERIRQLGRRIRQVALRNSKKKSLAKRQQSKSENRARKALKTITFIMGAFVLCWTPWHICATIEGFCNGCVNPDFYALSYWLCYLNSPINPFCYALANQQFKKTFIRVLKFDLHRT
ncbi:muscarinic acetylcholine receptor gar-2-like [Paramacrobiotus metropolitanus]|uniref:muscarinic acetylcholine receptor gar-2-like n=1 Tax=Paramacrobiotus metropolitanus TaxID=2943436 RepID=UPI0024465425|nr:muscarinic acetylcholine receptor gar-2-like [Paramacrobiotus metropolitanus]XP_055340960.1 muscarinic acetylcholine receptor gar-2-like [Paramacrobiotus metropolitanus]XP_055340961.1 muscarinic acetylcholine receptor gar-2-like [Paramacrobiotus metropolitanus]XP_055340962.1 muscarinic acetylcholine receptor gar-2-like [Paramacrobiotus metropolitanus]